MSYALELISIPAEPKKFPHPLLFVHGGYVAAWSWMEHFLPWFVEQGFDCHALSLRGHGNSEGHESLHSFRLRDFVDDVASVIDKLKDTPVLIGHSMGGMIVMKLMQTITVKAAVLLAPVPPCGLWPPSASLAFRDPLLFSQMSLVQEGAAYFVAPEFGRRAFFSNDLPDADLLKFVHMYQPESFAAILDMTWSDLPDPKLIRPAPTLVVGGERDILFPSMYMHQTATSLNADLQIHPHVAHAMMLEPRWQSVAINIRGWLADNVAQLVYRP